MILIAINCFVIIVNFCNHLDKALTEIFQFHLALVCVCGEGQSNREGVKTKSLS